MAGLSTYIQTNYPSPSDGDNFLWGGVRYTYDASPGTWIGQLPQPDAVTDAATTMTAPENPNEGDLWYDGMKLNVRTGDSWVDANPQPTAESLGVGPVLIVQRDGSQITSATTTLNFTSSSSSSGGAVNVRATTSNQAEVNIVFPEVPTGIPNSPARPMSGVTQSVLEVSNTGAVDWRPVTIPTTLGSLTDVATTAPGSGQVLTYNDTASEWQPMNIPTGTSITINAAGNELTIDGKDTDIPVVTGASINASDQLVLTRNGSAADLVVTLPVSSGATPTPVLNVNGTPQVARITFDSDFTLGGDAANTTIGAPRVAVSQAGTSASTNVRRINFTGATVSNDGDGVVTVAVPGGGSGGEIQTSFTNITQAESLVNSAGQATNNRREFTLTGTAGGSRFRTMFRANEANATLQWTSPNAALVSNFTVWGSRTFGLWDRASRHVSVLQAPPNGADTLWPADTGLGLQLGEVIMVEVDLANMGSITFRTNSNTAVAWDSVEQNAATNSTTTAMVMPETPAAEPPADPPVTTGQPYPASNPAMCGPYFIQNPPASNASDFITWDQPGRTNSDRTPHPRALDGKGLAWSPITGGNGSSGASTGGNNIWGTNANRHPAGAVFIGQIQGGSRPITGSTNTLATSVATMCTIVLPHEDDCGVIEYLDGLNLSADAWHNQSVYSYTRLGGTYSGTRSTERRIRAWRNSALVTTDNPQGMWLYPNTLAADGRNNDGTLFSSVNPTTGIGPDFAPGTSITDRGNTVILGMRTRTDNESGANQGAFSDQYKFNMVVPFSGLFNSTGGTLHQRDFGESRYAPFSGVAPFKTQWVMAIPGTENILFMEARQTTPMTWSGSQDAQNRVYAFELGYRVMRVANVNNAMFLTPLLGTGLLDARTAYITGQIRGNDRDTGVVLPNAG